MALHTRYNESGTEILCELKDISQLEDNGYKYKESPIKYSVNQEYEEYENEAKKTTKGRVIPKVKTTRRSTRKTQVPNEKDIIL